MLAAQSPKTPWSAAAEHAAASFGASELGKHQDAFDHALEALTTYERVGDLSTAAFARVRLARAAHAVDELTIATEQAQRVRAFAERNGATRFLDYLPPGLDAAPPA
jgi:hypothetical protein